MQMDARMVKRLRHAAAFGAYGVTAGLLVVLAGVVWLALPVRTGGSNAGVAWITGISAFVAVLGLGAAHIALARQLTADEPDDSR